MANQYQQRPDELEIDDTVVALAKRWPSGWWEVTNWPTFFGHSQAITTLTVTELLESGYSRDDPLVSELRQELR